MSEKDNEKNVGLSTADQVGTANSKHRLQIKDKQKFNICMENKNQFGQKKHIYIYLLFVWY